MAYPVRTTEVRRVMQPVLGTRLTTETPLCDQVAEVLRHYRPARETADELCTRLKDVIFGGLYELLGYQMMLQMDNGAVRRIFLRDVDYLVDESVGLLLGAYVLVYYNLVKAPPCRGLASLRGRTGCEL